MKALIHLLSISILLYAGFPLLSAQTVNTGQLHVDLDTELSLVNDFENTAGAQFINNGSTYFYGDYKNDGIVDYTDATSSMVHLTGTTPQVLSGSAISYLNHLTINNIGLAASAVQLQKTIAVTGTVTFQQGIIDVAPGLGTFLFQENAVHEGASDDSHVTGYVRKTGSDAFEFPIGDDGHFRSAARGTGNDGTGDLSLRYDFSDPTQRFPTAERPNAIAYIDDAEYWTVHDHSGTGGALELTLSWDTSSTTPQNLIDTSILEVRIVRYDPLSDRWVDEGGTMDPMNRTVTAEVALTGAENVFTLATAMADGTDADNVNIYNGISANADGVNDYLFIENIQDLPNNRVTIFNRLGVKVFETTDYDTSGNVFTGISEARATPNAEKKLPNGTYFYVLGYDAPEGEGEGRIQQTGYLYLVTE